MSKPLSLEDFAAGITAHWSIEASLHHVLDVQMGEDDCQITAGKVPENVALIRRMAFNVLKACGIKGSLNSKASASIWQQRGPL